MWFEESGDEITVYLGCEDPSQRPEVQTEIVLATRVTTTTTNYRVNTVVVTRPARGKELQKVHCPACGYKISAEVLSRPSAQRRFGIYLVVSSAAVLFALATFVKLVAIPYGWGIAALVLAIGGFVEAFTRKDNIPVTLVGGNHRLLNRPGPF